MRRRTNVPALRKQDAQEEEEEGGAGAEPSVEDKGRGLVEEGLVMLFVPVSVRRPRDEAARTLWSLDVCAVTLAKAV